jgi:hypothetical protein
VTWLSTVVAPLMSWPVRCTGCECFIGQTSNCLLRDPLSVVLQQEQLARMQVSAQLE